MQPHTGTVKISCFFLVSHDLDEGIVGLDPDDFNDLPITRSMNMINRLRAGIRERSQLIDLLGFFTKQQTTKKNIDRLVGFDGST